MRQFLTLESKDDKVAFSERLLSRTKKAYEIQQKDKLIIIKIINNNYNKTVPVTGCLS